MCFVFFVTITFLRTPPAAASSQLSTQALCEPWPRLPTQHRARVGGLMEYGSNWPPIQSCGLQVSLSSERTQMDAHILKVSLQFSHFALGLFGCVARRSSAIVHICIAWQNLISQISSLGLSYPQLQTTALISHHRICLRKEYLLVYAVYFWDRWIRWPWNVFLHTDWL